MLQGSRPVKEECAVQLMTFMAEYTNLDGKEKIWKKLCVEAHTAFPSIISYASIRPYFKTDHWIPSVKFAIMEEIGNCEEDSSAQSEETRETA